LYYSRIAYQLIHGILLTMGQKWQKQKRQKYTMLHKSYTKSIKDVNLSKLSVDSMVDPWPVAEWVDTGGHSETESESTELTIYDIISMADSVKFRWSLELFFG